MKEPIFDIPREPESPYQAQRATQINIHLNFLRGDQESIDHLVSRVPKYSSFDIMVVPSLNEGWGLSAQEARLFGKAIIASRVGGIPEQITHESNGLLVPPEHPQAIAETVIRIAQNPELRQKLEQEARRTVELDGDFNKILASQILPLFERVLAEAKR